MYGVPKAKDNKETCYKEKLICECYKCSGDKLRSLKKILADHIIMLEKCFFELSTREQIDGEK